MNQNDVNILEETWLCQSFLKLKRYQLRHKLFAGGWSQPISREMVARPDVAVVLPYDPVLDKVVLIEQFRIGAMADEHSPWLVEIVAGVAEEGESIEELAHRETAEESGLVALELLPIYRYWVSPGFCNERVELFCARVDASQANGIHGLTEEDEDIRVSTLPAVEAFAAVANGKINNAATMLALQWLQLNHQWLREKWSN
jgi:ADP-ribose pyrophosphatase